MMAMTVDRFLVVRYPLKARKWCTAERARKTMLAIFSALSIYNIPYFFTATNIKNARCQAFDTTDTFALCYAAVSLFINAFLPCAVLLSLNVLIVTYVHRHRRIFRKYLGSCSTSEEQSPTPSMNSAGVFNWRHLQSFNRKFNGSFKTVRNQVYRASMTSLARSRHASAPDTGKHNVSSTDIASHVVSLTALALPISTERVHDEHCEIHEESHIIDADHHIHQQHIGNSHDNTLLPYQQDGANNIRVHNSESGYGVASTKYPNTTNRSQRNGDIKKHNYTKSRSSTLPQNFTLRVSDHSRTSSSDKEDGTLHGRRKALSRPVYYRPHRKTKSGRVREVQLTAMLLLVAFTLLLLTTPQYIRYLVYICFDSKTSAERYATFVLIYHITNKLYFTNFAVNFFLYSISGSKFREDIRRLVKERNCSTLYK